MGSTLGKVVRLNLDGSVPADNPFADQGGPAAEVWTLGHRNPLGIAFASQTASSGCTRWARRMATS
jgi:aldose sugar dehydrogenase